MECWLREQIVFKEGNKDIIIDCVSNDMNTDHWTTRKIKKRKPQPVSSCLFETCMLKTTVTEFLDNLKVITPCGYVIIISHKRVLMSANHSSNKVILFIHLDFLFLSNIYSLIFSCFS